MPAQKRHPPEDPVGPSGHSPPPEMEEEEVEEEEEEEQEEEEEEEAPGGVAQQNHSSPQPEPTKQGGGEGDGEEEEEEEGEDSDGEGGSDSATTEEFILVKLGEIRKEVQCPICLGIIRKTRTVMECLHRFCRECIDKSMRLGNNECPACRTHCASRRSLRDDPNYDALIAALYPDIDKYEEEELAFHEEEKNRNKKIQASIAETLRRQTEALGRRRTTAKATAAAFVRKSQGNYRSYAHLRGRGRNSDHGTSLPVSEDEEEEDVNGNDGKDSSSADEPSPERRQKRRRRWRVPRSSPARTVGNTDADGEENDDMEANRGCRGTSPLRAGNREMLAWGRGGVRSQTRHGNSSGSNGRSTRAARMTKLSEYLRNLEETDDEFDVHLTLLPLDEQSIPNLQRPYLCCRPTLSISHLCQFIALQTCIKAEDVQIYVRKPRNGRSEVEPSIPAAKTESDPLEDLQAVDAKESLAQLQRSFISTRGDLVFIYCSKKQS